MSYNLLVPPKQLAHVLNTKYELFQLSLILHLLKSNKPVASLYGDPQTCYILFPLKLIFYDSHELYNVKD